MAGDCGTATGGTGREIGAANGDLGGAGAANGDGVPGGVPNGGGDRPGPAAADGAAAAFAVAAFPPTEEIGIAPMDTLMLGPSGRAMELALDGRRAQSGMVGSPDGLAASGVPASGVAASGAASLACGAPQVGQ